MKILDRKIKQNKADYDLYRQNAEISALSSSDLDKYEYLTNKDLGYKRDPIQKAKFEYSPLCQVFNKGLTTDDKSECLLKRLKNIEDKVDSQLDLIKSQGIRQQETVKGVDDFYYGPDQKILELQKRAISASIDNITNGGKVFSVKINKESFQIEKYTNLAYFGNLLFKSVISLKKVEEQQEKILGIIKELEKKIGPNRPGRPLSKENKDDAEDLSKNGKEILKTRDDIINAYEKSRKPLKTKESE